MWVRISEAGNRIALSFNRSAFRADPVFGLPPEFTSLYMAVMKLDALFPLTALTLLTAAARLAAGEVEPGFTSLCDGTTFNCWKLAESIRAPGKSRTARLWRMVTDAISFTLATQSHSGTSTLKWT